MTGSVYSECMIHTAKLIVKSQDIDTYNHVNNAVYLQYLEYGRMEFLNAIGFDFTGLFHAGYYLYVTHIDIYYRASAVLNDELSIEVIPVKQGKLSGTFHQVIRNRQGLVCAEADVSWGCVNKEGRPSKIPDEFRVKGLEPDTSAGSSDKRQ